MKKNLIIYFAGFLTCALLVFIYWIYEMKHAPHEIQAKQTVGKQIQKPVPKPPRDAIADAKYWRNAFIKSINDPLIFSFRAEGMKLYVTAEDIFKSRTATYDIKAPEIYHRHVLIFDEGISFGQQLASPTKIDVIWSISGTYIYMLNKFLGVGGGLDYKGSFINKKDRYYGAHFSQLFSI